MLLILQSARVMANHRCTACPGGAPRGQSCGKARLGKKLVTNCFKIGQNPLKTVERLFATNLFSFQWIQRISKWT